MKFIPKESKNSNEYLDITTMIDLDMFKMSCSLAGSAKLYSDYMMLEVVPNVLYETDDGWLLEVLGTDQVFTTTDIDEDVLAIIVVAIKYHIPIRVYVANTAKDDSLRLLVSRLPPHGPNSPSIYDWD